MPEFRQCTFCTGVGSITRKTGVPGPKVSLRGRYVTEMCPVCNGTGKRPMENKEKSDDRN